MNKQNTCTQDH